MLVACKMIDALICLGKIVGVKCGSDLVEVPCLSCFSLGSEKK
jgi:hypothetical protein